MLHIAARLLNTWTVWGLNNNPHYESKAYTMKNTAAIDKIISELAFRDYRAYNPLLASGKPKYKKHHPYTLSPETNEARGIKADYLADSITEEEYKAYCLKYNLTHR